MKKSLIITSLLLTSMTTFASKARMRALGQDIVDGSLFIDDDRRVFTNPALLMDHNNLIFIDYGRDNTVSDSSAINHQAEAGLFRSAGSFAYGLALGHEDSTHNAEIQDVHTTDGPAFLKQDNRVDFFLAGNAGTKWGLSAYYASSSDEAVASFKKKYTGFGINLGILRNHFELYADVDIAGKAEGAARASDQFKRNSDVRAGIAYTFNNWKFYGDYTVGGYEYSGSAGAIDKDTQKIIAGVGKAHEINPISTFFTDLKFSLDDQEQTGSVTSKSKVTQILILIGFEAKPKDWLDLRAAYSQEVAGDTENSSGKSASNTNTGKWTAGASFKLKNVSLDISGELSSVDQVVGDASLVYRF